MTRTDTVDLFSRRELMVDGQAPRPGSKLNK
jgi:hypothetical protein